MSLAVRVNAGRALRDTDSVVVFGPYFHALTFREADGIRCTPSDYSKDET